MTREMLSRDRFEDKGSILEYEYFGEIDHTVYNRLVRELLDPKATAPIRTREDAERAMMAKYSDREKYNETLNRETFINYSDSMELVEKCQPGNPLNPRPFFASALLKKSQSFLNEGFQLKFFTAVGSSLDRRHGVDAYIKLYDEHGREMACATFDLSQQAKPEVRNKFIIVVTNTERDLYDKQSDMFDQEAFEKKIESEARRVLGTLQIDLEKRKNTTKR